MQTTTEALSATPEVEVSLEFINQVIAKSGVSCELVLPSGKVLCFGGDEPRFRMRLHSTRVLRGGLSEYAIGRAYVNKEFDIDGDLLEFLNLRRFLKDKGNLPLLLKFWTNLTLRSPLQVNRDSIAQHYSLGDDFYLSFIDTAYRYYSHCVFHRDDETLEQAAEHKLEQMFDALELQPGMRLLDVGCGWGGTTQYCGKRGVQVTGLTLTQDSYQFTSRLIEEQGLDSCRVLLEDILAHRPDRPYDAVVIYGVIEHIPYYRQFFRQVWNCLRPGGLFYLDASATVEKYDMSDFTRNYIWHGTHTFMCLQELIQEIFFHGLSLVRVRNETHDYHLTMRHWAQRFDANRSQIVDRWGEKVYRAFRIYLWGGCHALKTNELQAYHLVARREAYPGPRPGLFRRLTHAARNLF